MKTRRRPEHELSGALLPGSGATVLRIVVMVLVATILAWPFVARAAEPSRAPSRAQATERPEQGASEEARAARSRAPQLAVTPRAELWRQRRQAKMDRLEPDEHAAVEDALTWVEVSDAIEKVRHGWNGVRPAFGGFPSGSGQAVGIEYQQAGVGRRHVEPGSPNRFDVETVGAVSLHGYSLLRGEVSLQDIAGSPLNLALVGYRERNAREDFYGLGPNSLEQNRTLYDRRASGLGTSVWWRRPDWLGIGGGVWLRDIRVDNRVGSSRPAACTTFPAADLAGCGNETEYVVYDTAVEVDWRNDGKPIRGGFYAVQASRFRGRETAAFDFDELHIDAQHYVPLLYGNRVFALRAQARLLEPRPGARVPFFLMPKLGGSNQLRGFAYGRFTDTNSIILQAEYRTEVWMAMDLALFVDAGRVARDRSELFESLEVNYGFGLRFMSADSTFLRTDFAFGGDSFRFLLTFDDAFDDLSLTRRLTERPRQR